MLQPMISLNGYSRDIPYLGTFGNGVFCTFQKETIICAFAYLMQKGQV